MQEIRIRNEMDLVLADTRVKALLINKFCGLSRCDEVALAIRKYLREHKLDIPIVIRLNGTGSEKVAEILKDENLILVDDLHEAIAKLLQAAAGR